MNLVHHVEGTRGLRRFKPYPDYKDPGVEWLGKIPAHWSISRIYELTTLLNGFPFDSEYFVRGEGAPLVRIRDLNATETEVNYIGPVVENAWIEPGDVIIGMDGDFNVARWRGQRALLNQRMCCLRPRNRTDSGFIAYLLPLALKVVNDLTYSTTVKHLSSVDVRKIRLGAPPEPEQRAVAAFLDRETERIDALVAKKERLIELLREKRTTLITRAVTKGLDPNVPMKDSGVEWLGEIPAHWFAKKLKAVSTRITKGTTPTTMGHEFADEGVRFVKVESISDNVSVMPELCAFITPETDALLSRSRLRQGDVLVGIAGAIGRIGLVDRGLLPANTNQAVGIVRVNSKNQPRWLAYCLGADFAQEQFGLDQVQSAQANLSLGDLANTWVPVPPASEQRAISAFLDRETTKLDALIAKVREATEHLKELRTALISAAVTGKIDVREEAA